MQHSESLIKISSALIKAQGELKNPAKNKTVSVRTQSGSNYSYKYAELSDILDQVKPVLSKNGLTIVQGNRVNGDKTVIVTMLLHESGEWIQSELDMPNMAAGRMNEAQALGSILTYGRRYSICSLLNIAADEDTDTSEVEPDQSRSYKSPVKTQSAPNQTNGQMATEPQKKAIYAISKSKGIEPEMLKDALQIESLGSDLTKEQASRAIEWLNSQ